MRLSNGRQIGSIVGNHSICEKLRPLSQRTAKSKRRDVQVIASGQIIVPIPRIIHLLEFTCRHGCRNFRGGPPYPDLVSHNADEQDEQDGDGVASGTCTVVPSSKRPLR